MLTTVSCIYAAIAKAGLVPDFLADFAADWGALLKLRGVAKQVLLAACGTFLSLCDRSFDQVMKPLHQAMHGKMGDIVSKVGPNYLQQVAALFSKVSTANAIASLSLVLQTQGVHFVDSVLNRDYELEPVDYITSADSLFGLTR